MSTDWKKILETVAPGLATMLGGPLAGTAVGAIAQGLLGKPSATQDEIAVAVGSASPDTLVKLKQIEADLKQKFLDGGIKLEELGVADRESARQREIATRDHTTQILAYLYTAIYFALLWAMWKYPIDPGVKDMLQILLGVLTAAEAQIMNYFFGSSAGSAAKDRTIAKALE